MGTLTATQIASAAVVDREPVGGCQPGTTSSTLDKAIKRNSVPTNCRGVNDRLDQALDQAIAHARDDLELKA